MHILSESNAHYTSTTQDINEGLLKDSANKSLNDNSARWHNQTFGFINAEEFNRFHQWVGLN